MTEIENPQLPLYLQLVNRIEEQINSGELKPGQRIPSENEFCEMFNISRTTVRQALHDLATRGKVIRVKGRGSFIPKYVARKPFDGLTGFSKEVNYIYNKRSYSKVLRKEIVIPDEKISQSLGIKNDEAVIKLQRARYISDIGIAGVDTRFLPLSRFKNLIQEDLEKNSLYDILISKYQTIPSRAYSEVSGGACPHEFAVILELQAGDPVSVFRDVIFDQNEIPFDYGENVYRIDRYTYRIEIFDNRHPEINPFS
jgi:DNA-binding GntR family transcriptional regulator